MAQGGEGLGRSGNRKVDKEERGAEGRWMGAGERRWLSDAGGGEMKVKDAEIRTKLKEGEREKGRGDRDNGKGKLGPGRGTDEQTDGGKVKD